MYSKIVVGVRTATALHERETHIAASCGKTVLAVVEKRYAVMCFGHIGPLVIADLELCSLPRVIACSGTVDVAKLNLILNSHSADINIKACLKKVMLVLPVELYFIVAAAGEIPPLFVCRKLDIWHDI
jgi:hypothetical protein